MPDPELIQLTDRELENQTVDTANFPYVKMRGMLVWNGTAWEKWDGQATFTGTVDVNLDNADDDVLVYGWDGSVNQKIKTDAAGELQVDVLSSALPSGAATSAKQLPDNHNVTVSNMASTPLITGFATETTLASIKNTDGIKKITDPVAVTGTFWQTTQPVSLASVPSHAVTNAGTFAVQVDGDALTSLQLIDDTIVAPGTTDPGKISLVGGKTNDGTPQYRAIPEGAGGRSVIVEGVAGGTTVPVSFTGSGDVATQTTLALIKAKTDNLDTALSGIKTGTDRIPAQGTAVMTGSTPVTIATNDTVLSKLTYANTRLITAPHANNAGTPVDTTIYNATQSVSAVGISAFPTGANAMPIILEDGAGNLLTSNSTTYTAKFGLDVNVLGTKGTAFSTAGKVDVKVASGDIASGAIASGAIASGAIASGAVASGAFASGSISDGADVTLGAKADAKNSATDTTAITAMQVLKQISYMLQNPVTPTPGTTTGWDSFLATSSDGATALTNSAQAIKASAGSFGGYYIYNPNTSATYVHVYNVAAASVTVGTTNPKLTFCIPASSAANIEIANGVPFGTALSCSATTTGGGNTAPTTALEAIFFFK